MSKNEDMKKLQEERDYHHGSKLALQTDLENIEEKLRRAIYLLSKVEAINDCDLLMDIESFIFINSPED